MNKKTVIILLACYNGSKFVRQQLESIISQTYINWVLNIRDDGSTDDTLDIIFEYSLKEPRIQILKDDLGNLRSSLNFNALMRSCQDQGEYFMFCDQDDIWHANKVEETLKRMQEIENKKPSLVFGTQSLIDENGEKIPLEPRNYNFPIQLETLLATNFVYGCTMMINKELLKRSISIPASAENHDYWIALIAAISQANTSYISTPLMSYRQHSNNVSGSFKDSSFINRLNRLKNNKEIISIRKRTKMFGDLLSFSNSWISDNDKKLIFNYNQIVPKGGIQALSFVLKNQIRKISIISTFNYYYSILRG